MERYLFFNSSQNDVRQYQAGDFAWYFGNVLKSGLIHTDGVPELQVKCEGSDLRTYVEAGKAIIQGHAYENTSNHYLEHALPEATMDRIDRIVLRLDKRNQSRFIRLFVLQGEPGSNPVAPTLQRDEFIHELSLAQIRVRANTSALNPVDLVDERLNEELCGLVSIQDTGFVPWADYNNTVEILNGKAEADEVIPLSQKGVANGVASLDASGNVKEEQLGNVSGWKRYTKGTYSTSLIMSMRIGTSSNYTYTIRTATIPLPSEVLEVEFSVRDIYVHAFKGIGHIIAHRYTQNYGTPEIFMTNRGYGSTYSGTSISGLSINPVDFYLVDAYFSGNNLIVKFTNRDTTDYGGQNFTFDYITRG